MSFNLTFNALVKSSAVVAAMTLSQAASAHFQLIHTDKAIINKAGNVPALLAFWHPMLNEHAMDMDKPDAVYMVHKGKRIDLADSLRAAELVGPQNTAKAWQIDVPVKRSGDYVLVVEPAPYYEESEDIYIQQITKAYLNRNELPTDWSDTQGLATEIKPLVKPYNVAVGTSFRGVVLSAGEPVPYGEIEVEFMHTTPDVQTGEVASDKAVALPGGAMTILTDGQGIFTMAIPKAGFWGFAALGSGPQTEFNGKELSQDAVIWIKAHELN